MASFEAKIGWKMPRKRKKKITGPFRSYTTRNGNSKKIVKMFKKLKKYLYGFLSIQNRSEKAEKERK